MYTKARSNNPAKVLILVPLIFLMIGVIFLAVGIGFIVHQKNLEKECTEETTAKVVDILSRQSTTKNNGHRRTSTVYCPVFEFTADGELYTVHHNSYSNPCDFEIGDEAALHYSPDDPETFYAEGESAMNILSLVFTIIGGIFTLILLIIIISMAVSSKRKKSLMNYAENQFYEEMNNRNDQTF